MRSRYSLRALVATGFALVLLGAGCLAAEAPAPLGGGESAVGAERAPFGMLTVPPLPESAGALVPTDRAISLAEAVSIGMYEQPELALAEQAVASARARLRQTESGYLPTLGISSQHTRTGSEGGGPVGSVGGQFTAGGYTANFSARELIWDFGQTPAAVGRARRQYEAAVQAYRQARQDLIVQVEQAYYTLLQDQQLLAVQEQNLADQQAHLGLASARFEAGVAPRADVVRAEAAVAEAALTLATAQNAAAVARVNLNLAMGVDVRTPTQVEETEVTDLGGLEPASLVQLAFGNRPSVRQARANAEAAVNALREARAGNRPTVSLTGNYGLSGPEFPPSQASWAYGVSLQWPLFDVGLTAGRVQEAEANLLSARVSLRQVEQRVSAEVVQAYLNVQTSRQQVTAAGSGVASAEESLRLATGRYESGVATYVEVLDAESAALTARTDLVNARYGLSSSLAALRHALGLAEGDSP
jgi:TolC family type I secretion outer membrane protein